GQTGGDVHPVGAQGGGGGLGVEGRGQGAGGPQQVVRHGPQGQPGGVRLEVPGGQVGERGGLPVRDRLFHDGVLPVVQFGLKHAEGAVGEDRVVAPGVEQLALPGGRFRAQASHPAHDQTGGDVFALLAACEGGVGDLGDLGVGDHLAGVGVHEGVGVADRYPGIVADAADRGGDGGVHAGGQGEVRAGGAAGGHHVGGVELA